MNTDHSIGRRWAEGDSHYLPHEAYVIRAYVAYMKTNPMRLPALLNSLAEPTEMPNRSTGDPDDCVRVTLRSLDLDPLAVYVFWPSGRMKRVS